ncbi:hypothetical protein HDU83_006779 [Entophlyctis luteolus]|nr:hypothetical protein HDU83_006779 [Entophlyctis luteolus]
MLKAELSNLTNLRPGAPDYEWNFKVAGLGSSQTSSKSKCQLPVTAILKDSMKPYTSDSGDAQRILTIETRGLDYISWQPTNKQTWVAEGAESGTVFDDIEFEDGETDWAGYDEKGGCPVEVLGIQGMFVRSK